MTDPFEQFAKLAALLKERVKDIGLTQATFQPLIDEDTGRIIAIMFVLDDPLGHDDDEPLNEEDDVLAGIEAATAEDERQRLHELAQAKLEEQMEERRQRGQEMRERLHDPSKGFLDD